MTKLTLEERINQRRLILGPRDDLMVVRPLKHPWAWTLYEVMHSNQWSIHTPAVANDAECFKFRLTDKERLAYTRALAFLSNLDGIQFNNINMNIRHHVTSPEVEMCLGRQADEEALHCRAYSLMIETITDNPLSIYGLFEEDDILARKNEYILKQSRLLGEDFSARGFALAVVSNIMLEGLYFFTGFLTFYLLMRDNKMKASADMIRYIQRDEEGTHLVLFLKMLETLREENPEIFDSSFTKDAQAIIRDSQQLEAEWGKYVNSSLTGCSEQAIDNFTKYLANLRAKQMGIPEVFEPAENPFPWFASVSLPNVSEVNFFEARVTDYQTGALEGLKELDVEDLF